MKLSKLIDKIEQFAPPSLAESWDNVGLIVGDREQETASVVLCLDVTRKAYELCLRSDSKICVCHHPFLFDATKKLDFQDPYYQLLRDMIKADIAIYAAHTNLDACVGGVNDALANQLELVPVATFMPSENPFDFQRELVAGTGRICIQKKPGLLFDLARKVTSRLETFGCHVNFDCDRPVGRILVVGGSYDSQWNADVLDNKIDVVISGEIKHRDMVFFDRFGVAAIAAGHDATERTVLPAFKRLLEKELPELKVEICHSFDYTKLMKN